MHGHDSIKFCADITYAPKKLSGMTPQVPDELYFLVQGTIS